MKTKNIAVFLMFCTYFIIASNNINQQLTLKEVNQLYPQYLLYVPNNYHQAIVNFLNYFIGSDDYFADIKIGDKKNSIKELLNKINKSKGARMITRRLKWGAIAYHFGLNEGIKLGKFLNFFCSSLLPCKNKLFEGKAKGWFELLPTWRQKSINIKTDAQYKQKYFKDPYYAFLIKENLAQTYKIHLMPQDKDIVTILIKLFNTLKQNTEVRKLLVETKVLLPYSQELLIERSKQGLSVTPRMVIYPIKGKENAQKALDIIYETFKNDKGLDITPRFNEKVTSLIYFAQGESMDKMNKELSKDFEQPNMIYYKSDFTGKKEDYHLKNPAHK